MTKYFLGIDVGSKSVRCALVDSSGNIKHSVIEPIEIWSPAEDFYQQSSENIWNSCCKTIREVLSKCEIDPVNVCGIGFDATCSLVVLDETFKPLSLNLTDDTNLKQNVIMWMDHRASKEAQVINSRNYEVLKSVGGKISLEMQPPKLLWLKQHMPPSWWNKARYFMDLPDFLTWRATTCLTRSMCSITCKWLYSGHGKNGWDISFWKEMGLLDVIRVTESGIEPGKPCGSGLSADSATEMSLNIGTPVAASLIDAYAGALGLFACRPNIDLQLTDMQSKLALICGTSTCHMTVSREPRFVPGVWGPYYSVMIPKYWTNEGGQSVTGNLLDHIITTHPAYSQIPSSKQNLSYVYKELHQHLIKMQEKQNTPTLAHLTADFHVYPDFHGNRSPLANPLLKGMVSGFTMNSTIQDLAIYYLAMVQALAYSTKQIIEAMENAGHSFECILMCGGLAKNDLYVTTHADVTGLAVVQPHEPESVLLGAAMLAAVASGEFPSIEKAMVAMGGEGDVIFPQDETKFYHKSKYEVYKKMLNDQREYTRLMNDVTAKTNERSN